MRRIGVVVAATLVAGCASVQAAGRAPGGLASGGQPQRDSFVVMARGQAVGFQRTNRIQTQNRFRVEDEIQVRDGSKRWTEIEFTVGDSSGSSPRARRFTLEYADGWESGKAPSSATGRAIDDGLVTALISTFAWARDSRYTITATDPDFGTTTSYNLQVSGTQRVTVPSGTFETYLVQLTSDDGPTVMLNVASTAPHRVVRIAPVGKSLEMVLAGTTR